MVPTGVRLDHDGFTVSVSPTWARVGERGVGAVLLCLVAVWGLGAVVTLAGLSLWDRDLVGIGAAGMAGGLGIGWLVLMVSLAVVPSPQPLRFVAVGRRLLLDGRPLHGEVSASDDVLCVGRRRLVCPSRHAAAWVAEAVRSVPGEEEVDEEGLAAVRKLVEEGALRAAAAPRPGAAPRAPAALPETPTSP
jgi:hypothetical protein